MKLLQLLISLIAISLLSCQSNGQKENAEDKTAHSDKTILHGNWIPIKYIRELKKTKSPIEASKVLVGYSELVVDTNEIKGDSIFIGGGWNNHEGGGFYMWFKPGLTKTSFPTSNLDYDNKSNFYELGYEISKKDTSLILYHYNPHKKLLDKSYFSKVNRKAAPLSDGLQYFVNSVLISGKYKISGNGQTVEFTNEGNVKGIENIKKYFIATDFVVRVNNDIDNIIFDLYSDKQKIYAYKIKMDTLDIFKTKSDSNGLALIIDSLKFHLIRQK